MHKHRFHLLGLAHLPQHAKFMSCAFTQKNRKLAKMLTAAGHDVFFYGSEGSDVVAYCDSPNLHFIQTHSLEDIRADYGDGWNLDDEPSPGYDWRAGDLRHDFNGPLNPSTLKFNAACIEAINTQKQPDDFLLLTMGIYQRPIAEAVQLFLTCESGIGYRGSYARFRAFESSAIQNLTYGGEYPGADIDGSYYDRVIPNFFDPNDIEYSEIKDDYYLYVGRMIRRKGIEIAAQACDALGVKLVIAGAGAEVDRRGWLVAQDFQLPPGTWEYVGYADVQRRKTLMSRARAVFVPTEYMEIFGGVHVEAMLSGTPVIVPSFGVFPETVPDVVDGVVGFRCYTLQDFMNAAIRSRATCPPQIRDYAQRFLMDRVVGDYIKWFDDLYEVYRSATIPGELGWGKIARMAKG